MITMQVSEFGNFFHGHWKQKDVRKVVRFLAYIAIYKTVIISFSELRTAII